MTVGFQRGTQVRPPESRAELDALAARRGELRAQLEANEARRVQMADQAMRVPPESRGTLNQRIATLDARIAQAEAQLMQLDDAIAAGLADPRLVHGGEAMPTLAPPPPTPPPGFEPIVLVPGQGPAIPINPRNLAAGGLLMLSLLALVGWIAWRRAVATLTRNLRASSSGSAELTQLQQSVDAIALEVERISENQRFVTKLLNQQAPDSLAPGHEAQRQRVPAEPLNRRDPRE